MTTDDAIFDRLSAADRALLRSGGKPAAGSAMLATLTEARFSDPQWIFERKLDGVRCLAYRTGTGTVRLLSRNDKDLSRSFPEIAEAVGAQTGVPLVVDGEIVAFSGRRTSFGRLQGRLGITDPVAAQATGIGVYYYVFDVLHAAGRDTRRLPQLTRKRLLRRVLHFEDPLRYAAHRLSVGEQMYEQACARGDEGVIAKRADAPYTAGRSADWLKFKCVRDQEFVVGGWTDPKGSRRVLGALLLGYYDGDRFMYAGKVGTGFDDATLARTGDALAGLGRDTSPFDVGRVRERDVHWVRPELVVQIAFSEWTRDGMLRHPRFQGVRTDKAADAVVRESR